MQGKIEAFIDSYDYLTILVDKSLNNENKRFYLVDRKKSLELEILNVIDEHSFYKYIVKSIPTLALNKDYIIKDDGHVVLSRTEAIHHFKQNVMLSISKMCDDEYFKRLLIIEQKINYSKKIKKKSLRIKSLYFSINTLKVSEKWQR